jgi:transcriptional regulator with XRE-family HTH domain
MKEETQLQAYRIDLINGAMGAQRLTNEIVAEKANVTPKVVSAIRNGARNVMLESLIAVVTAVGLTMEEIFQERAA